MKNLYSKTIMSILALLVFSTIAFAQTSAFTYQGKLTDGSVAANGQYDFTFRLFDVAAGGTQVGTDVLSDDVQVTAGIFTVNLNFGASPFTSGADRYLEIAVRPGASTGAYTTLAPRQPLTSSPFSIKTLSATSADSLSAACVLCVTDGHIVSIDGSKLTGTVTNALVPAGNISGVLTASQGGTGIGPAPPPAGTYLRSNGTGWALSGLTGDGSGLTNLNGANVTGTVANASSATTANSATTAENVTGVVGIRNGGTGSTTQNFVDLTTNQSVDGDKRFSGAVGVTGANGVFSGNGSQLTNLNGANLSAGSVNATQIGALAITSTNLGDGSVLTNKISGGAVTTGKLADGSVTKGKIAEGTVFQWNVITGNQQGQPNNGYIVNSGEEVRISLPTAPQVGDIIRVACADNGGFRITQNAGQSVAFSNSEIHNILWIPRESFRRWSSVASSADGTKLVVGVIGGLIYSSTDSGETWIPRESQRVWTSVASSADGTKLVATESTGLIYTSTDSGVTWIAGVIGGSWRSVASSADGTKLVAVAFNGQIYTSTDSGGTWTPRESNHRWTSVASSADGRNLVAVINPGQIYTSADSGVTWTPRESSRTWEDVSSSSDGTKLVAVAINGQIYTSADSGETWIPRELIRGWISVASSADGTKLVAATTNGPIYTSTDSGVTWTPQESSRDWSAVASSSDGSRLVAVVNNGQIYVRGASTSTAGEAGGITGGNRGSLELVYLGAGKFLILSQPGGITLF